MLGAAGVAPTAAAMAATTAAGSQAWFTPHLGTAFAVRGPKGEKAELVLSGVSPLMHAQGYASAAQAAQWCFAAQFTGEPGTPQIAGMTDVQHPVLGRFAMMISPVGGDGRTWEAVFNRVKFS